ALQHAHRAGALPRRRSSRTRARPDRRAREGNAPARYRRFRRRRRHGSGGALPRPGRNRFPRLAAMGTDRQIAAAIAAGTAVPGAGGMIPLSEIESLLKRTMG